MLTKIKLYILFLFIYSNSFSQNCDCLEISKTVIDKVKNNYIGYQKINNNRNYKLAESYLKAKSTNISSFFECRIELQKYLDQIRDKHIRIFSQVKEFEFLGIENTDSILVKYFSSLKFKKFEEPEIWRQGKTNYIFIPDSLEKEKINVYVLYSSSKTLKVGQKRAVLYRRLMLMDFINSAKQSFLFPYVKNKNKLIINGNVIWEKVNKKKIDTCLIVGLKNLKFETDNQNYSILTIPSFAIDASQIRKIIDDNQEILRRINHLIIDIRDNGGGSTASFKYLYKLIYTNPIIIEDSYYKGSLDNLMIFDSFLKMESDTNTKTHQYYKQMFDKMEKNIGKIFVDSGSVYFQDSIFQYPKRVSILTNRYTGSAAELFIISALQSKKVTLFGENTMGTGDLLDAYSFQIPNSNLTINLPIALRIKKVYKNKIHNVGIPPHIPIKFGNSLSYFIKRYGK